MLRFFTQMMKKINNKTKFNGAVVNITPHTSVLALAVMTSLYLLTISSPREIVYHRL